MDLADGVGAWMPWCLDAWCVGAWVRGCVGAWVCGCVCALLLKCAILCWHLRWPCSLFDAQALSLLQRLTGPLLAALEPEAIPPYVYQLILFATSSSGEGGVSGAGDRRHMRLRVLHGVMDYFDQMDLEIGTTLSVFVSPFFDSPRSSSILSRAVVCN